MKAPKIREVYEELQSIIIYKAECIISLEIIFISEVKQHAAWRRGEGESTEIVWRCCRVAATYQDI